MSWRMPVANTPFERSRNSLYRAGSPKYVVPRTPRSNVPVLLESLGADAGAAVAACAGVAAAGATGTGGFGSCACATATAARQINAHITTTRRMAAPYL